MSDFESLNQNVLALVALIVSLVALLTTFLQVLQQYFSSAEGYRRCASSVMGLWSEGTHRRLRATEFRFEVVFETPVLLLAHPDNQRGPIHGQRVHYILGTEKSYQDTKTRFLGDDAQRVVDAKRKADEQRVADNPQATARVHTADDERASWVTLLSTLQQEERSSREWDEDQRNAPPKTPPKTRPPPSEALKPNEPKYTLCVGIQPKTRSWDFMPAAITRPYATSAICHLVEMVAMMGMYWKVFDQTLWNLRAEGNGFILTSTNVQGLGVMVTFTPTGKSDFGGDRTIPSELVKELAFGTVPNIFDNSKYLNEEANAQSLELLFGSKKDVTGTLESLGCTSQTLKRYNNDHRHMFSVSFEIIGMLGKVIRIRGSSFRMVPNPTSDQWLKKIGQKASWRITRMMEVFQNKLEILIEVEGLGSDKEIMAIVQHWEKISSLNSSDELLRIHAREAVHDALDETTKYLLRLRQADVLNILVAHITKVVEVIAKRDSSLNTIFLAKKEDSLLNFYFDNIRPAVIGRDDAKRDDASNAVPSKKEMEKRNVIWISLIFRMLCWLLLHDFHRADVMIVPADLKGSRMPVYIG